MNLYVTRCALSINGVEITDFKSFTEITRETRKRVDLMYKSGSAQKTQRYEIELEYCKPKLTEEFNFENVEGASVVVEFDGGLQYIYSGVACMSIGDAKADMENEIVRTIHFCAEQRNGNDGSSPTT
jgi:hypothetical protein